MTARARYSEGHEWTNARGQVFVQAPDHPNARADGFYPRARIVLERKIGRYMLPSERAYHVDGDPGNDDPENLMLFESQGALARHRSEEYARRKAELEPLYGKYAAMTPAQREDMLARQREREQDAETRRLEEAEALRLERLRAAAARRKARREAS